jgi:hypothetical protein
MTEAYFLKLPNRCLIPATEQDEELLSRIKTGEPVKLKFSRPRNYQFHKKFFALMNLAFDYWEPPEHGKGSAIAEKMPIEKNFDRFRKDIIILAGFYTASYRLNGDVRYEAKSIAFGNMSEDEFEKLFSAVIDVILKNVMHNYTDASLRETVENMILDFA